MATALLRNHRQLLTSSEKAHKMMTYKLHKHFRMLKDNSSYDAAISAGSV